MANRYGYVPNVNHLIGANGRIIPVSDANPLPVTTTNPAGGEPSTPEEFAALYATLGLGSTNYDASGRSRVSQLLTLGDYKPIVGDLALFYDTDGTGTDTHSVNDAWFNMQVGANEWLVKQTKMFHPYASGKSQLIEATFVGFTPETDVVKRVGYFSSSTASPYTADYDGIYLESSNGTVKLKIDRLGTNVVTQEQADWLDPLDGTGPSGLTVDWDNFNVAGIDFLWLGGTTVRLFFFMEGRLVLATAYVHSNTQPYTFIQSPNQPLRAEIRSTGGTGSLKYICAQVSFEGALGEIGAIHAVNNSNTDLEATTNGTRYALLGLRLQADKRAVGIIPRALSVLARTNDDFLWEVRWNPTVAGTFSYSDVPNSNMQVAWGETANTVTEDGLLVTCGCVQGNGFTEAALESALRLGSTLDGTMDELVVVIMPYQNGLDIHGTLTWREII